MIQTNGTVTLLQVGNNYALQVNSDPLMLIKINGSAVITGQFGSMAPYAVVKLSAGGTTTFDVAWAAPTSDQFAIWSVDGSGNYVSTLTGVNPISGFKSAVIDLETTFNFDLNRDGVIGNTLESAGSISLAQVADRYYMNASGQSGSAGVQLKYNNSPVSFGQFGSYHVIAAEARDGGFQVTWKSGTGAAAQYVVWYTDGSGNYTSSPTGVVGPTSLSLKNLETSFSQDLNGDGNIGVVGNDPLIETDGRTLLNQIGDFYFMGDSFGSGPSIKFAGEDVVQGQFGIFNPIGAEKTDNGYEVAWKANGFDQYVIWLTDDKGNYLSSPTGVVGGGSLSLQQFETSFAQDLNGDGTVGPGTIRLDGNGGVALELTGGVYRITADGSSHVLKYQGGGVTFGQFGGFTPTAVVATPAGYDVAWRSAGTGQYVVWLTDADGNYLSAPGGLLAEKAPILLDAEVTFGRDLNGDGRIALGGGRTLDLTSNAPAVTVDASGNTCSVSAGLNNPDPSFVGTPDLVELGAGSVEVHYALRPAAGTLVIDNFKLGLDQLKIDLLGANNSVLQAADTRWNGQSAVALFSAADPTHGVILSGLPEGQSASDLLASHVGYASGHALIN